MRREWIVAFHMLAPVVVLGIIEHAVISPPIGALEVIVMTGGTFAYWLWAFRVFR